MSAAAADEEQAEVIGFMMRPDSYPNKPEKIDRIDTHGAIIFLAGELAYKLKRAVKLPYLDFSTLEKRRDVCRHELALNRETAPSIYRQILPICRDEQGRLTLGGDGDAVDWVIEMHRFDENAVLDRIVTAGQQNPALFDRLAFVLREFHRDAPEARSASWIPTLQTIVETLEETFASEEASSLNLSSDAYLAGLNTHLRDRTPLLRARQQQGFVRRCHGDLHLKNIVLLDGEPTLFDCIEFDENLTNIDILYDIAFLLMDLCRRGLREEASRVLNVYFERGVDENEWAGLALLPLFLSLRAAIRAMVGVHGLPIILPEQRSAAEQDILNYMILSKHMLAQKPPIIVAIGGLSGTGKTTLARALAPHLGSDPGAIHLRSDVERKVMQGVDPLQYLAEAAYAEEITEAVYTRLSDKAAAILAAGHSVIVDSGFREIWQREAIWRAAEDAGAKFYGLWLEAEPDQLIERVERRKNDASDADADVVRQQIASVTPPADWIRIDASGSLAATVSIVLKLLPDARNL